MGVGTPILFLYSFHCLTLCTFAHPSMDTIAKVLINTEYVEVSAIFVLKLSSLSPRPNKFMVNQLPLSVN